MRLGINGWRLHGQRNGVGRYVLNTVRYWTPEVVGGRFDTITLYSPRPLDRRDVPIPDSIVGRVLRPAAPMLVWENAQFGPRVDDDVLFCPSYSRPLLARGRTVVAIHDATPMLHPEYFPGVGQQWYNRLYGWSGRHATLVMTNTQAAARDISRCWGIPAAKIRVVPLGAADEFTPLAADAPAVTAARARYLGGTDAPFFLFVGKLSGRRNIPLLIEAFAEVSRRTARRLKLVLVGHNTLDLPIRALAARADVADDIHHVGFVADGDLNALYNAAEAFVSPSVYETVSLPALEAQATGTPVVCVDAAGMREVTGGAAQFVPEMTSDHLATAMLVIARDPDRRADLAARGLENARRSTWRHSSERALDVIAEASHLPPRR